MKAVKFKHTDDCCTGTGFAPLGNLRTTDQDGPYSLQYLPTQVAEIKGTPASFFCFANTLSSCGQKCLRLKALLQRLVPYDALLVMMCALAPLSGTLQRSAVPSTCSVHLVSSW